MSVIGIIPDLTDYIDIHKVTINDNYAKSKGLFVKNQDGLFIIKYNKHYITRDNVQTLGHFRSVITDGERLLCYSPPKSIESESFMNDFPTGKDCILEEFIEGTMINCFYHNNEWKIATRWNIGANRSFYQRGLSFCEMFKEAMSKCQLEFDTLNKKYCYSFVLQHPQNRIVVPFNSPNLVLIATYELNGWSVKEIKSPLVNSKVAYPWSSFVEKPINNWDTYIKPYVDINTHYTILGVVLKHSANGSCVRSKVRNPIYEKVRHLKGNSPKIQFQYYHLYQQGKVTEFLQFFPEHKQEFWNLRGELIRWTNKLFELYKNRYISKNISEQDIPYQFRPHVWSLHDIYQSSMREKNLSINKQTVINYIYNLHPSRLMYSINYPLRQKDKDDVKGSPQVVN